MPSRSSFADSATGQSKRKDTIARDVMEVICEIGICSPEVEKVVEVVEVIEEEEKEGKEDEDARACDGTFLRRARRVSSKKQGRDRTRCYARN